MLSHRLRTVAANYANNPPPKKIEREIKPGSSTANEVCVVCAAAASTQRLCAARTAAAPATAQADARSIQAAAQVGKAETEVPS